MASKQNIAQYPNGFSDGVTIRGLPILNTYSGQIWWVDSNGAQIGDGKFNRPFSTVDTAVNHASAGDIIMVKEGHAETFTAAAGIDADVAGIAIIGLGQAARRPTFTFTTAAAADIDIDAANITIQNCRFVCGINSQTAMVDVNSTGFWLEGCEFLESSATGLTCVDINGGAANACDKATIRGNTFLCVTAANWDRAIELGEVADAVTIENNTIIGDFDDAGIHNPTGKVFTNLMIRNNFVRNDQSGQHAIELVSACTGAAYGNRFVTNAVATSFDAGALACSDNLWNVTTGGDTEGIPTNPVASGAPNALGTVADSAATGAVTTTDTAMSYVKQLVTQVGVEADTDPVSAVLSGAGGITTWKSGAAPATGISMSEVLRYISENLGAVDSSAATGVVTATDNALAYIKQLVTQIGVEADTDPVSAVLSGAGGITTWKSGAAPATGVSLSEAVRYFGEQVINGSGTALPSNTSLYGILAGATGVTTFPAPAAAADAVSLAEVAHYDQSLLRDLLGSGLGIQDIGNIYYVDGGSTGPADDTGAGTSRAAPKKIFQSAYDLTTTGNNDIVIVLNYGSAGRALETWPIELNKDMVHIVGVGNAAHQWAAVCPPSGSATHAFEVTGHRNTISNLCINGGDGKAGIHVSAAAAPWGLLVRQCEFGVDNASATTQEGILIDSGGDAPYLTVLDCNFRGTAGVGGGLTGSGIKIAGNATRGTIGKIGQGNFFQGMASGIEGIEVTGGLVGCRIEGNRFAVQEDTQGMAITLGGTSAACWVSDNVANENNTEITANPFLDSSSGANHWGLNYKGITATMPA